MTEHARKQIIQIDDNENDEYCLWWLRTTGRTISNFVYVNNNGAIYNIGKSIYSYDYAVRPAMWIGIGD